MVNVLGIDEHAVDVSQAIGLVDHVPVEMRRITCVASVGENVASALRLDG